LRVLVVDDDAATRSHLTAALRELGHVPIDACDGFDALRKLAAEQVDVLLCDWIMPSLDGAELCRRVRAARRSTYTYVILLTGLADRAHLVEGLHAGADEYLTKPLDFDELAARLVCAERVLSHDRRIVRQNARLRHDSQREMRAARTDPLTRLGNRRGLEEDLATLFGRASRYGHRYCAVLADVDRFKAYNDRYGHLAGDEALRGVARAMTYTLREGDAIYRYGGEEFLAILPEQSLGDAAIAVERVREAVARLAIVHDGNPPRGVITISAGIAELVLGPGASPKTWLACADAALYRAKAAGRDRIVLHAPPRVSSPPR
jgi:diguanylate cyclase (GGDEF)-like protein